MADKVHLEKLTENVRAWNEWRAANPEVIPDLRYAEFTAAQKQFSLINGGPVNLSSALLFKAGLNNATLVEADLAGAELVEADLSNASLNLANLTGANLTDAILVGADLSGAALNNAIIIGADFSAARNLTIEQIEAAAGDFTTLLPEELPIPDSWRLRRDDPAGEGTGFTTENAQLFIEDEDADLYAVLGVGRKETTEKIRAVFRTKAKAAHPDLNPGDPNATRVFARLIQAYSILRDPKRRKRYDRGEIGPDGEETDAFIQAQRDAELRRQLWRYAALGIAATLLVGLGLTVTLAHLLQQSGTPQTASRPGVERAAPEPQGAAGYSAMHRETAAPEEAGRAQPSAANDAPSPAAAVTVPGAAADTGQADAGKQDTGAENATPPQEASAAPDKTVGDENGSGGVQPQTPSEDTAAPAGAGSTAVAASSERPRDMPASPEAKAAEPETKENEPAPPRKGAAGDE